MTESSVCLNWPCNVMWADVFIEQLVRRSFSLSRVLQLCGVPEDLAAFPDDLWGHRDHRPRAQPAMMTERAAVYTSGSPRAAEIQRPLCIWRHEMEISQLQGLFHHISFSVWYICNIIIPHIRGWGWMNETWQQFPVKMMRMSMFSSVVLNDPECSQA